MRCVGYSVVERQGAIGNHEMNCKFGEARQVERPERTRVARGQFALTCVVL